MTKLFEDTRTADGQQLVDGDSVDMAWTKLLPADPNTPPSILIRSDDPNKPLAKDVLVTIDPETGKQQIEASAPTTTATTGRRRESIIGTFHRQLRQSLKAVSEAPGPLTR